MTVLSDVYRIQRVGSKQRKIVHFDRMKPFYGLQMNEEEEATQTDQETHGHPSKWSQTLTLTNGKCRLKPLLSNQNQNQKSQSQKRLNLSQTPLSLLSDAPKEIVIPHNNMDLMKFICEDTHLLRGSNVTMALLWSVT